MYRLVQKTEMINEISLNEISDELQQEVQESSKQQKIETAASIDRRQKMSLKIVHLKPVEGKEFTYTEEC